MVGEWDGLFHHDQMSGKFVNARLLDRNRFNPSENIFWSVGVSVQVLGPKVKTHTIETTNEQIDLNSLISGDG